MPRTSERIDLGCVILSAVANVVANLALVPTFGAVGAAMAMTISEATLLQRSAIGVPLYFGLLDLFGELRPADVVKLFRA